MIDAIQYPNEPKWWNGYFVSDKSFYDWKNEEATRIHAYSEHTQ